MEDYQKAYEKALKLLKIRPHIGKELERKLVFRGFSSEIAARVTEKLKEQGLIDDKQFSLAFLNSLIRFKSFGFYGLLAKLLQRGITKPEAEKLLKENFSVETEKQTAFRLVKNDRRKDKIKLAQKLSRKGFRTEVISDVLKTHFF